MLRQKLLLLLAAAPLIGIQSLRAATVQVGTCIPNVQSYPTISAAVSGVPAGSTVQVCPGIYAEQVMITQSLTLIGFNTGTANLAQVTVPTAGLVANTTSMFGESVAAQILVLGAGPVTITNIAVDGTGGDLGCASWVAGIFYGSGSNGTISQVRASSQVDTTCGVGIWAENSMAQKQSITIKDTSVYNVDSAGIFAGSGVTPTLSVAINNNVVNAGAAVAAIDTDSVAGLVSGNDVAGNSAFGVFDISGNLVMLNTIMGPTNGIFLGNGGTATANNLSGSSFGILLGAAGAALVGNRVMSSMTAGVELGCFAASVSGNFINDAPIGVDSVITALGSNIFANTAIPVSNGCAAGAAGVSRASVSSKSSWVSQWHTPATPLGTRTK